MHMRVGCRIRRKYKWIKKKRRRQTADGSSGPPRYRQKGRGRKALIAASRHSVGGTAGVERALDPPLPVCTPPHWHNINSRD